jgi:hypothetical protein
MLRSLLTIALGIALLAGALGCGDDKKSQPPKNDVPIIDGGPKAAGGQPGKGGNSSAPPGTGTAQ